MGLFNKFKKNKKLTNSEKVDAAIKKIDEGANITQTLVDAYYDLKSIDALHFSFKDINSLGDAMDCIIPAIEGICNEAKKEGSGLYRLVSLVDNKIEDTKVGKAIDEIVTKTKDCLKLGDGTLVPALNPTVLLLSAILITIKEQTSVINDTCNKILTFLKNDKESQIEGDLNVLNNIVKEYKFNWNNKEYRTSHHKLALDIKRSAEQNIIFFKKSINSLIKIDKKALVAKTLQERQKELENEFSYFQLSLYIYGFSTFLEVLLLGNFNKDYLTQTSEKLNSYSQEYLEVFNEGLEYLEKTANSSTESKALKGIGDLLLKTKEGSWLNKKGEEINKASIKQSLDTFMAFKDDKTQIFRDNINLTEVLFNECKDICFDEDGIYLIK